MSSLRPSPEGEQSLHRRLLAGEADAASDLVAAFLEPLLNALYKQFPDLHDPTLVDDMVIGTLLRFPQQPEKYDPERGSSLWSYLYRDAYGDIVNAYRRETRQRQKLRLVSLEDVALEPADGNNSPEAELMRRELLTYLPEGVDGEALFAEVRAVCAAPQDYRFLSLYLTRERRTAPYAEILGVTHLSVSEQRRDVKREKDKWQKRLLRLGVKFHETE